MILSSDTSLPHILGILPARGGSKGIPGKNTRELLGKPLLHWAATALLGSSGVSRCVCSTDSQAIAAAAKEAGLEVPFMRPESLGADNAMVVDVLLHALAELDDPNRPYTHIALVQATTPTVTVNDIAQAMSLIEQGADTVISGFMASAQHPALMYTLDDQQQVQWLFDDSKAKNAHSLRRQDFPPVFVRTGLLYIVSTEILKNRHSLYGDTIQAVMVDEQRAVTIDEEHDFITAQLQMEKLYGRP